VAAKQRLDENDFRALFPEHDLISDPGVGAAVVRVWKRLWEQSDYTQLAQVPVSLSVDYPQVRHTQAVLRMALATAEIAHLVHDTIIRRDILVAGALLMDVSKLVEYQPGLEGGHQRTELGLMLPHGTYTAHLCLAENIPLDVIHIVMAHSPNGGKAPATIEAHILDWLDQLDLTNFGYDLWKRRVLHYQP